MLDWLLSPIDASRVHGLNFTVSWHARTMVLGWGILAPMAVLVARFFKVMPCQDWPNQLDSQIWWRSHWMGFSLVFCLSIFGLFLVLPLGADGMTLHRVLGYSVLVGMIAQVTLGLCRGSKGGPTAPANDGSLRGDHYDMTPWRRRFEVLHKSLGYCILLTASVTIVVGLWDVNGPRWMWISIILWWIIIASMFCLLQKRGMAVDTYQAIWGPDAELPGNQQPAPKWGMQRRSDLTGDGNVRRN